MLSPRLAAVVLVAVIALPALALLGPAPLQVLEPDGTADPAPRGPLRGNGGDGLELGEGRPIVLGEVAEGEAVEPLPDVPGVANITFAPRLEVDPARTGGEPGLDLDAGDCVYINAIATRSLWRKCPYQAGFTRLNPPAFVVSGLDSDVAFDLNGYLWYSDLWLGSASVTASRNAGGSWQLPDYLSFKVPVDDRQWLTPAAGAGNSHMIQVTNQIPTGVTINRCVLAPPPDAPVLCAQTGYAVNDVTRFCICPPGQPASSRDGMDVIVPYFAIRNLNPTPGLGQPLLMSGLVIEAAVSHDGGLTWATKTIATNTGDPAIFPVAAFDAAGNAYLSWAGSRGSDQPWEVYLARSLDGGDTWGAQPVKISAGGTNVLPWLAAGAEGHVALAWYHADDSEHPEDVQGLWYVDFAESFDMHTAAPTVARARASPLPVHADDLSISGLNGNADRDLLDFLQVGMDSQGRAHIAYADDHTDGHDGHAHIYYLQQTS